MHGNVAEWTLDEYEPEFYAALEGEPAEAPWSRPEPGARHTVRGGAFDDDAPALRCAARLQSTPAWQRRDPQLPKSRWWNTDSPHVGFRLVRPSGERSLEEIRAYWDDLLAPVESRAPG
jgi:formylglycine-generating enzyme required for sulfatase activity